MDFSRATPLFDKLFEGVYLVDRERRIVYWNKAAEAITGFSADEVIGRKCYDNIFLHVDECGKRLCESGCPLAKTIEDGQFREVNVFLRHKKGHRLPVEVRALPLLGDVALGGHAIEMFTTQSGTVNQEVIKELARKAFIDSQTGIPNREYAHGVIKSLSAAEDSGDGGRFGMLLLKIENWQEFAKTQGVAFSEALLKASALTLTKNVQDGDVAVRWESSRFMLIVKTGSKSMLGNWAAKLKTLVEQSSVPGHEDAIIRVNVGGLLRLGNEKPENLYRELEAQLCTCRTEQRQVSLRD